MWKPHFKNCGRKVCRNTAIILLATRVLAASSEFGLEKHGQKCRPSIFVKKALVSLNNLLGFFPKKLFCQIVYLFFKRHKKQSKVNITQLSYLPGFDTADVCFFMWFLKSRGCLHA